MGLSAPRAARRPRVLVLDDDPERLAWFRLRLGACAAVFAQTYEEAAAALRRRSFDIAYLDHDLGGNRNGTDLAYWFARRLPRRGQPRFVVHSANPAGAFAMFLTLKKAGCSVEVEPFPPHSVEDGDGR